MDLGLIQAIGGNIQPSVGKVGSAGNTQGGTFGSVLSSMTNAGAEVTPSTIGGAQLGKMSDDALIALFDAETVEELEIVLSELTELFPEEDFLQMEVPALLENILPLLEQIGLSEEELSELAAITDIWSLLNVLDQVAPKLFEDVSQALEGKGEMPKQEAIELLVLLKVVTVQATESDLTMKQEQQLFSLQGFLQTAGERFETTVQTQQANRNNMLHLMESQHPVRLEVQNETTNGQTQDQPKETASQSTVNPLTAIRTEGLLADQENKQNVRSETLIREMQAIFKRANFGQAGGTNRISIQLYPEHLGQVRVELTQVNGIMTARILASTAQAKEMIESQLQLLRSGFAQQNLQVDRIDIAQSLQDTPRNERDNAFSQHFRHKEEDFEEQEEQSQEDQMTFEEYMIELEG